MCDGPDCRHGQSSCPNRRLLEFAYLGYHPRPHISEAETIQKNYTEIKEIPGTGQDTAASSLEQPFDLVKDPGGLPCTTSCHVAAARWRVLVYPASDFVQGFKSRASFEETNNFDGVLASSGSENGQRRSNRT